MKTAHNPKLEPGEKLYKCHICDKKFTFKRFLERHLKFGGDGDSTLCVLKHHKQFCMVFNKEKHRQIREYKEPIKCQYCDVEFTSSNERLVHMYKAHDHNAVFCQICAKKCRNNFQLEKHLEVHNEDLSYQCNYCGKKFKSKHNLEMHTVTLHEKHKLKYTCQQCGRGFYNNNLLSDHISCGLKLSTIVIHFFDINNVF